MKSIMITVAFGALASTAFGADPATPGMTLPPPTQSIDEASRSAGLRAWKISLIPVAVSQGLDVYSSYGMRELNPLLAGSDGGFGGRAAILKLGVTGALLSVEYLVIRRHPQSARVFSKLNWAGSIATTGLAAHNLAVR
jgi:hypothetical protein